MSAVVVLPMMATEWAAETIETMRGRERSSSLLVVDNSPDGLDVSDRVWRYHRPESNAGVPASWNAGVRAMFETQRDHVVLLSEAIRFTDGGAAFFDRLEQAEYGVGTLAGWHLIGLGWPIFERCGRFDEQFFPGYYEDSDMIRRMALAGVLHRVELDADVGGFEDRGTAHCLELGLVDVEFGPLTAYYLSKWGGTPGSERYRRPFGRKRLAYWPAR